jgi:hypothetical protein
VEAFLVDPCAIAIPSPSSELEVTGFDFNSALGFAGNGGGRPGGVGRWWCDGRIHLLLRPRLCRLPEGRQQRRRGLGERKMERTRRSF